MYSFIKKYNEKCSFESNFICNITEGHTQRKDEEQMIGGFTVNWNLVGSNLEKESSKQSNNKTERAFWKVKDTQDLRSTNWVMMLIMSLVQKSQISKFCHIQNSFPYKIL